MIQYPHLNKKTAAFAPIQYNCIRATIILSAICLVCFMCCRGLASVLPVIQNAVRIQGNIEFDQLPPDRSPLKENRFFCVEIADCNWRIKIASTLSGLTNDTLGQYSYAFDGAKQYRLSSLDVSGVAGVNPSQTLTRTAFIADGSFLPFDASEASFLWIAFASDCYLKSRNYKTCEPVWAVPAASADDNREFLTTQITQLETGSIFPGEIFFFCDGSTMLPGPGSVRVHYPKPFDAGFKKAHYKVDSIRSFHGSVYPQDFTLEVYNTKNGALTTNDLYTMWQVKGHVSEIDRVDLKTGFRPDLAGTTRIIDLRYSTKGLPAFEYLADTWKEDTNGDIRQYRTSKRGRE